MTSHCQSQVLDYPPLNEEFLKLCSCQVSFHSQYSTYRYEPGGGKKPISDHREAVGKLHRLSGTRGTYNFRFPAQRPGYFVRKTTLKLP